MYPPKELAGLLGVSVDTLAKWRKRNVGEGPPWTRVGPKVIRYNAKDVEAYLASREER